MVETGGYSANVCFALQCFGGGMDFHCRGRFSLGQLNFLLKKLGISRLFECFLIQRLQRK
ncbi:hypothetical protein ACVRZ3_09770 [Streptococcus devriesei]